MDSVKDHAELWDSWERGVGGAGREVWAELGEGCGRGWERGCGRSWERGVGGPARTGQRYRDILYPELHKTQTSSAHNLKVQTEEGNVVFGEEPDWLRSLKEMMGAGLVTGMGRVTFWYLQTSVRQQVADPG